MQHVVNPKGGCFHGRPDISGRRAADDETQKARDPSCPATCQSCKQEERKDASTEVSGIPPGPGAVHWPLPEESDTVPKRGQKEASTVPSPYPQQGCRKGGPTKRGLFAQVVGMGTRGNKRGTLGEDRAVRARSYGPT